MTRIHHILQEAQLSERQCDVPCRWKFCCN